MNIINWWQAGPWIVIIHKKPNIVHWSRNDYRPQRHD